MNWITRNSASILFAGLILSFLCGSVVAIHAGPLLRYPDEREWTALAANLATKHVYALDGIHPTAFRPPGFPFLLSLWVAVGIGNVGLRFVNLGIFFFPKCCSSFWHTNCFLSVLALSQFYLCLLIRFLFIRPLSCYRRHSARCFCYSGSGS